MCGLVGMAGDLEMSDRQVFRDLLDVCQVRGRDSTGVINVNKQQAYGYFKSVGPPAYMFDRRGYSDNIETGNHAALIGHCRHKTVGAVNIQNAHPFDFEDEGIIGVHNGTLRNYAHLDGHTYQKVDSEVLYGHLAKNGPEETFDKIDGAWACVWWDDKAETLNFIRNEERPLWFCWSEDRRKLFWASEIWMLGAAERRVKFWKGPKDDYKDKYIELPVDTLWSFSLIPNAKKGDATLSMKPAKKIEKKTVLLPVRKPWSAGGNGHSSVFSADFYKETADIWNRKSGVTHRWDEKTGKLVEIMTYNAFLESRKKEEHEKNKGGSVPNPFHQKLDDQLPVHLRPKPETFAIIQGGKSGTTDSTSKSTTASQSGAESEKELNFTEIGASETDSRDPPSSTTSPKTNKRKLTARLSNLQQGNGGYSSNNKVSFRCPAGMPHITDETTGNEYSEQQVQENTGGECSFCDEPIGDLTEISEFFDKNRFICTHCTESSLRSVG